MTQKSWSPTLRAQLEAFVTRVRDETRVPGIGVAVSIDGERFEVAAGTRVAGRSVPLDTSARFHLGCTTKLLLAALALELVHSGALDLDAAIGEYLAELRALNHGRSVRVAHLLSHTSGYRGTHILDQRTRVDSWDAFVAYLRTAPALFAPGSVFSYEHTESVVLGEIVRRVTSRPSLELIAEQLLAPLGISAGVFAPSAGAADAGRHRFDERSSSFLPIDTMTSIAPFWLPAFSAYTVTVGELLRIAEGMMGTESPGASLLADSTRTALVTSVVRLPPTAGGPLRELLPIAFGLGTGEHRDGCRGNTGVSTGQCLGIRFDARARLAVAVALNATAPHLRDYLLATICGELMGRRAAPVTPPFRFELAELEGTYLGPGAGTVLARCEGERLVCEIGREHRPEKLRVELALDAGRRLVLRSPVPHLSLGFFLEPHDDGLCLMLGLSAYRRVAR